MYWGIVELHYGYIHTACDGDLCTTQISARVSNTIRKMWNKLKHWVCTRGGKGCLQEVRWERATKLQLNSGSSNLQHWQKVTPNAPLNKAAVSVRGYCHPGWQSKESKDEMMWTRNPVWREIKLHKLGAGKKLVTKISVDTRRGSGHYPEDISKQF